MVRIEIANYLYACFEYYVDEFFDFFFHFFILVSAVPFWQIFPTREVRLALLEVRSPSEMRPSRSSSVYSTEALALPEVGTAPTSVY